MTLGPVISCSALSKDKVVRSEDGSIRTRSDTVHGSGLKVHQDGPGDILSAACLIVVHIDSLKLEVGSSCIASSWVNAVLIRDDLPELGTDLVTALARLKVDNLTHR